MQSTTPTVAAGKSAEPTFPATANGSHRLPTDAPVLRNDLWHGLRDIERGTWQVAVFGSSSRLNIVAQQVYVVDDFGSLLPLDAQASAANNAYWLSAFGVDVAADAWWAQFLDDAGHIPSAVEIEHRTRDLLCPPPVTVEIVTEPTHPLCVASIVVGADPRIDTPLYSLHIDHEAPVLLSHAQLCAVALAASHLVKAATPRGALQ